MSDKNQQAFLGKKILQNCRNELYLDFPYLDGAFASLEYEADNNISTIATDGEKIYFNPEFLMKKYVEDSALIRRGYLHMLLHCLYLHVFLKESTGLYGFLQNSIEGSDMELLDALRVLGMENAVSGYLADEILRWAAFLIALLKEWITYAIRVL